MKLKSINLPYSPQLLYLAFCTVLYALLYLLFLNTNYVEGDDASTMLYHLMGRNPKIQAPYSVYHSGFDFLLSFVPNNETTLRNFSVYLSFFSGAIALFLTGVLLIKIFKISTAKDFTFLLLLPFIIPELIFTSGLYNTTNIGLSFILLSILFLLKYIDNNKISALILYTLFFAIAIPFRWSLVFILPVNLGLILFYSNLKINIKQFMQFAVFSIIGIFLSISLINITGYSPLDMVDAYIWGKTYMEKADISILSLIANGLSVYTLPLLLCLFLAFIYVILNKVTYKKYLILLLLSIAPFFLTSFHTNLKYSATLIPLITILGFVGYQICIEKRVLKYIFLGATIAIWFVGIHLNIPTMSYGPGFNSKNINSNTSNTKNPDKRADISKISPALSGGIMMPTPEGPRPLFGYFYVIFGGEWKAFTEQFKNERIACLQEVIHNKQLTFFQDRQTAYLQCDLYRLGYKSNTSFINNGSFSQRVFSNGNDTILLNVIPDGLDKSTWITDYKKQHTERPIIVRSSYTNLIPQIMAKADSTKVLNPFTIKIY